MISIPLRLMLLTIQRLRDFVAFGLWVFYPSPVDFLSLSYVHFYLICLKEGKFFYLTFLLVLIPGLGNERVYESITNENLLCSLVLFAL